MKKVVSVSVDEELLDRVREVAWLRRESVSEFVGKLIEFGLPNFSSGNATSGIADATNRVACEKTGHSSESIRGRYRRLHPNEVCPQCHEKNRDCICEAS